MRTASNPCELIIMLLLLLLLGSTKHVDILLLLGILLLLLLLLVSVLGVLRVLRGGERVRGVEDVGGVEGTVTPAVAGCARAVGVVHDAVAGVAVERVINWRGDSGEVGGGRGRRSGVAVVGMGSFTGGSRAAS